MIQVDVVTLDNKPTEKIELPPDIFGVKIKRGVLHEVVRNYLANHRQGTTVTKTRGLVSGGGRKPYRQKGTGRARAGSIRSPLWKGGGTVFGPVSRDYSYKLPKKVKWAALGAVLSSKLSDGDVIAVEDISLERPKTRELNSLLKGLDVSNVLIILPVEDETIKRAAQNIPRVNVAVVGKLNAYEILVHEKLLLTKKAIEKMKEVYLS
jgi:large subunit ribosomal protein L4